MASKRPKSRLIQGVEYTIVWCDPYDIRLDSADGLCDIETRTIYVTKHPSTAYYSEQHILEHECIHALLHERGIRNLDKDFEHCILEAFVDYIMEHHK